MARGMSLEEFRKELESNATVENEQLKKKIEELEKKIKNQSAEIKWQKEEMSYQRKSIEQLQHRCFAQTRGSICMFCGFAVEGCKNAPPLAELKKLRLAIERQAKEDLEREEKNEKSGESKNSAN